MSKTLKDHNIEFPRVIRFSWNTKEKGARMILQRILDIGSDCIIFVGNAVEGAVFVNAMLEFSENKRLPIISHWGIVGGNFHGIVDANKRSKLTLSFIQTCYAFTNTQQHLLGKKVFTQLINRSNGEIEQPSDLKSRCWLYSRIRFN